MTALKRDGTDLIPAPLVPELKGIYIRRVAALYHTYRNVASPFCSRLKHEDGTTSEARGENVTTINIS